MLVKQPLAMSVDCLAADLSQPIREERRGQNASKTLFSLTMILHSIWKYWTLKRLVRQYVFFYFHRRGLGNYSISPFFKKSAPRPIQSISSNVCLFVCLSVPSGQIFEKPSFVVFCRYWYYRVFVGKLWQKPLSVGKLYVFTALLRSMVWHLFI